MYRAGDKLTGTRLRLVSQLQLCVQRLLTDESFRQGALATPDAAFGSYRLSLAERSALLRLCGRLAAGATFVGETSFIQPTSAWV
jgi:hypothetical protein